MTRRTEKVSQAIREVVSTTILQGLRDPRIKNVTVLRAEASPDLCKVEIYVSVMGEDKVKALTLQGLNSARGFLQSKIADRIQTKNTPIITFKLENAATSAAAEANRILEELDAERLAKQAPLVNLKDADEDAMNGSVGTDDEGISDSIDDDDFDENFAEDEESEIQLGENP